MAKLTKTAKLIAEKVDAEKAYPIDEAVSLLQELATQEVHRELRCVGQSGR